MTTPIRQKGRPPIAVFADRSRDWLAAGGLIDLEPDDRYQVTDNFKPLSARRLAGYDVLAIVGQSPARYSASEFQAIVQFVRRGGGLLLAAAAGAFEQATGRPVSEMATHAIAQRFGITFLAPGEASDKPGVDLRGIAGYPHSTVRSNGSRAPWDGRVLDVSLAQWSPVRSAGPCNVLLEHRRTGEAAAVAVRFGKGRVVAVGSAAAFDNRSQFTRSLLDYLARARRSTPERKLAAHTAVPLKTRRAGRFTIHYPRSVAERVGVVLRVARRVMPYIDVMDQAKKNRGWRITLVPSCTSAPDWGWPRSGDVLGVRIGANACDASLAFGLGQMMQTMLSPAATVLRFSALGGVAVQAHVGLHAMRAAGYEAEASRLAALLEKESQRQLKGVDIARFYTEGADAPGLWIWEELARRHGADIFARFAKEVPVNYDWPELPPAPFTLTDLAVHVLSRVAGRDLYSWFAGLGTTVHPLPPGRLRSKAFKSEIERRLHQLIADAAAPASERMDAVWSLAARQKERKRLLRNAVSLLRAPRLAKTLIGAVKLAAVRDERSLPPLRALAAQRDDRALTAMASMLLVEQGDGSAADRLRKFAPAMDLRFQLDAASRLRRLDDPPSESLTLQTLQNTTGTRAVGVETEETGQVRFWPVVDGQRVGNVFCGEIVGHMPGNTHVPIFFIHWVYTALGFRRKGLIRLAFERAMRTARSRGFSCASLGTGTQNVAHALYRSFGFVDGPVWDDLTCNLKGWQHTSRVRGLRVRSYRPGDEVTMARLFNQHIGECSAIQFRRPRVLEPREAALLAYRGSKAVGFVRAGLAGSTAQILDLAWDSKEEAGEFASALVGKLHRELKRRGVERVNAYSPPGVLGPLLEPLGYGASRAGGLGLFAVLDLPKFLNQIRPLLERRLAGKQWAGTIALRGEKLRAALEISGGRVLVQRRLPARPAITLSGSDDTITRIVSGIASPFDTYWALELQISPPLTDAVHELLDKLFPRNRICSWVWG